METKQLTKREIIDYCYNHYKDHPERLAVNSAGRCSYLADNGNKCAVGLFMTDGEWQDFQGDAYELFNEYERTDVLKPEVCEQDDQDFWKDLQLMLHDDVATKKNDTSKSIMLNGGYVFLLEKYGNN